jgi:hypothetical protein
LKQILQIIFQFFFALCDFLKIIAAANPQPQGGVRFLHQGVPPNFFQCFYTKNGPQNFYQYFYTKMVTQNFFNVFTVARSAAETFGRSRRYLTSNHKVKKNWENK